MIILRFLHRLCLAGTWRREETRGGALVLPFGQVFTLNRSPGGKQPEGLITSPGITDQFASGIGGPPGENRHASAQGRFEAQPC